MQYNNHHHSANGDSFQNFFEEWLVRQQNYLNQLVFLCSQAHRRENELETLVGQVLSHYQHYYEAKSRAAYENVFLLFSPPWFSSFEQSFLWIAGFRPSLAFKIVERSVGSELTAEQVEKIQRLKAGTGAMEKGLNNEMAKIQESIAGPTWVEIVRRERQVFNGEVDQVIEGLREGFRDLVINADFLRTTTARELVDILSPVQAARFLAATAQLQLKVRAWGLQRDAERRVGV